MLKTACGALPGPSMQPLRSSNAGYALRTMSTSVPRAAAPRPLATRPRSQMATKSIKNVYEVMERYPNHPLLAFFYREEQEVVLRKGDGDKTKDVTVTKQMPTPLPRGHLQKDSFSRPWVAPELRTKSSLELHQLWYKCLLERNRFATSKTEAHRHDIVKSIDPWLGPRIDHRVRKTMARIKFVLNERRLALLEAQDRALARQDGAVSFDDDAEGEGMFEEDSDTLTVTSGKPHTA